MTIDEAKIEGYDSINFEYVEGFAWADPMFQVSICGKYVGLGETPKIALENVLSKLAQLESFRENVGALVRAEPDRRR